MEDKQIDIRNIPGAISTINSILNNEGEVEIKREHWKNGEQKILIVERTRRVRIMYPPTKDN